jgi:mRNA-degrading endonuclease HigB of HigAB toxin-antitoxin module
LSERFQVKAYISHSLNDQYFKEKVPEQVAKRKPFQNFKLSDNHLVTNKYGLTSKIGIYICFVNRQIAGTQQKMNIKQF